MDYSTSIWIVLLSITILVRTCCSLNCEQTARKMSKVGEGFKFDCTRDGNYKPMQCEPRTGYCFCVDVVYGYAMRDTSFRFEERNINDCTKVNNAPLSGASYASIKSAFSLLSDSSTKPIPPKNETVSSDRDSKPQRDNHNSDRTSTSIQDYRDCNKKERETFTQNIAAKLKRANEPPIGMRRENTNQQFNRSIIDKQFREFDADRDNRLTENEFGSFIRNVPMLRDQDHCSRALYLFCDKNIDRSVDINEFYNCLDPSQIGGKHRRGRKQAHGNTQWSEETTPSASKQRVTRNEARKRQKNKPNPESANIDTVNDAQNVQRFREDQQPASMSFSTKASPPSMDALSIGTIPRPPTVKNNKIGDSSAFDCIVARDNVKKTKSNFVPECTANGCYKPLQCQQDFCWCVSPVTGNSVRNIPKNATQSQCNPRPSVNCDDKQRRAFHQELLSRFENEQKNCTKVFTDFDSNDNGFIGRKEWRVMRKNLRERVSSKTKKCVKSELAFCDRDVNQLMSKDEWLFCCEMFFVGLDSPSDTSRTSGSGNTGGSSGNINGYSSAYDGVHSDRTLRQIYNQKKDLPRKGNNPFQTILKAD